MDLNEHLSDCEINFRRLLKILPSPLAAGDTVSYVVGVDELEISIEETAPYTTFLRLAWTSGVSGVPNMQALSVRMYTDAGMAEVVSSGGVPALRPRFSYPNSRMYQRDEKRQLNRHLGECLVRCLREGYRRDNCVKMSEI
ncbi:MAG: DUF1249 domain-containing protein [Spongiibacteraceae bacterium]